VTVSVIIAAYNVEQHITRALDSLIAQTNPDWEAIVIDDCSTDSTVEVVRRFERIDARIRIFMLDKNSGPSAARNAGIQRATGDLVAVLDADDAYTETRIADSIDAMSRSACDVVLDNMLLFDDQEKRVVKTALPISHELPPLSFDNIVASENQRDHLKYGFLKPVIRRQFLVDHSLKYQEDIRLAEDFFLLCEIALSGGTIFMSHKPGYIYTMQYSPLSGTASTGSRTQVRYRDRIVIANRLLERYGGKSSAHTVRLMKLYRTWMTRDFIIVEISRQIKARDPGVLLTIVTNPVAAFQFLRSSSTAARIRACWSK
jgi:succinoglycan biosynthesis protein ExoO